MRSKEEIEKRIESLRRLAERCKEIEEAFDHKGHDESMLLRMKADTLDAYEKVHLLVWVLQKPNE